ncbi:hypothetical protein ACLB2K_069846 [Fragaria x ananassa]
MLGLCLFVRLFIIIMGYPISSRTYLGLKPHTNPNIPKPQTEVLALSSSSTLHSARAKNRSSIMMTATSTALMQCVCSVPLARAVRTRALATAVNRDGTRI